MAKIGAEVGFAIRESAEGNNANLEQQSKLEIGFDPCVDQRFLSCLWQPKRRVYLLAAWSF